MIIAEVYESRRLFKWHWRIRFRASNGQLYGHQYDNLRDAQRAVKRIANPQVPMRLQVRHRDGTVVDHGLIR